MLFEDSEIKEFETAVTEAGLVPSDFELTVDGEWVLALSGHFTKIGNMTVTRKKNGVSRKYHAGGNSTAWVVEFQEDLRSGIFRRTIASVGVTTRNPCFAGDAQSRAWPTHPA